MSSSNKVIPQLFMVTQIRSRIGRPWWERRTLKALGFTKRNQTKVLKNTVSINGQLMAVKNLVKITPIKFVEGGHEATLRDTNALKKLGYGEFVDNSSPYLKPDGTFDMTGFQQYLEKESSQENQKLPPTDANDERLPLDI